LHLFAATLRPFRPMKTSDRLGSIAINCLIIGGVCPILSTAQTGTKSVRFIHPMDIPLELSGNFMEPRNDHFHSGLDMRTEGREGIPVRAVADGYVSRIKISPWGYGKAVYIQHPDGHTSVYGHLQQLQGAVAERCLAAHYAQKDFSIDVYPTAGEVPVKQGDVIGLSGNTGGSGGPHLHFELRRPGDQHAVDPEALGYDIPDRTPPEILGVRLYPLTDSSRIAPYPGTAKGFATQGGAGTYSLKPGVTAAGYGTIGLAFHVVDRYDGSSAKFGVRKLEVFVDSVPTFSALFDHIDFDVNRYCNAHMDHALFKGSKMEYHRCYQQPNTKLKIYGKEPAQGRIELLPGRDRLVRLVATDPNGNRSELRFMLHGATLNEVNTWPIKPLEGSLFRYDTQNILEEEGISLTLAPNALYDDAYVRYQRRPAPAKAIVPLHVLHDPLTPIQSYNPLRMALPPLRPGLSEKALIVRMDAEGRTNAVGGTASDGWITADIRTFGSYTIMIDTVGPTIAPVDLKPDMKGRRSFQLKVSDDLSGVTSYTGLLDGKWILLEYEPKNKTLTHTFDKHSKGSGPRTFALEVIDDRGNLTRYSYTFTH
jgi:hypothetical protein